MTTKAEIREHFTKWIGGVDYIDRFVEEYLKTVEEDRNGIYLEIYHCKKEYLTIEECRSDIMGYIDILKRELDNIAWYAGGLK